jgi:ferritin-like metal-binding protein YciE
VADQTMTQEITDKKKNDLVTKYLSDMVGLEEHIFQAIDKQVKGTKDEPENDFLSTMRDTLEGHVTALKARLEALGGHPGNPIKQAGSAVLGVAAGLIDKLRAEEVSKDLRDDYTALSLSNISYVMLATTASACNDSETAELASRHLKDNAGFTMEIGKLIPDVVVRDLKDFTDLNENAAEEGRRAYTNAWGQDQGQGQQGNSQKSNTKSQKASGSNGSTF